MSRLTLDDARPAGLRPHAAGGTRCRASSSGTAEPPLSGASVDGRRCRSFFWVATAVAVTCSGAGT